ncbi:MAG TPA: MoaD/ThiS family protein [Actinomycetota bacterium]|nr:MoaD/ThiS family protein [Actinomycetota bacterium]
MRVTVTCFGAMRDYLPPAAHDNRAEVDVADDATVGAVVEALGAPRRLVFAVLVDGTQAGLDAPVHDGADVVLMPPFTGGARTEGGA